MTQLTALIITVCIEVPIVWGVIHRSEVEDRGRRVVAIAAAASLLSHPIAWTSTIALMDRLPYAAVFAIVELGVVAFEAAVFRLVAGWPLSVAIVCAAVANAVSAGLGLLIWQLI